MNNLGENVIVALLVKEKLKKTHNGQTKFLAN